MIYPRESPTVVGGLTTQRHLYFDTMADFPDLPGLDKAALGSDAYCIDTQVTYILNSGGAWIFQSVGGGGGGPGLLPDSVLTSPNQSVKHVVAITWAEYQSLEQAGEINNRTLYIVEDLPNDWHG